MYGFSVRASGSRSAWNIPSVRYLPISCSTCTCLCMVVASTIAPAILRLLPSWMNDSMTGACATSAAPPRRVSKYARQSPATADGSAR